MTIEVSAFRWVPPFARGLVRDVRVRWALEEAGLPYRVALIDPAIQKSPDYRLWQPFGQVPAYRDGAVEMFESGAIVMHIARSSDALAPADEAGRARMATWLFAALNSLEPHIQNYIELDVFHAGEAWTEERRPQVLDMLRRRLSEVAAALGDGEYLADRFTAADLMMTTVLRILVRSGLLAEFATLEAYRLRCEARPAFARALEAQLATFRENAPAERSG